MTTKEVPRRINKLEFFLGTSLATAIVAGIIFVGYSLNNNFVNTSGANNVDEIGVKPVVTEFSPTPTRTIKPIKKTATPRSTRTEIPTPIATATDIPPLTPSKYALKAAGELGDGAKAMRLSILALEGKSDGLYGQEWHYTAKSGDEEWILAIFAKYYDPTTGRGNACLKGNCKDLVGKEIDIIVPPGPEYFDPKGKLHNDRPYVFAAAIIEGQK